MPNLNATLKALSKEHAEGVSALTDRANEAVRDAYESIADAPRDERYQQLRAAIVGVVEGARMAAHDAAVSHMLEALRLVVTSKAMPPIDIGRPPARADVDEYVDNAIDAARAADDADEGILSAAWHAERVIESEAFRTYDEAKRVAEQSLAAISDEDAERYGFRIAKTQADLNRSRETVPAGTRENENLIPLLGKQWDAVNDRRTCPECDALEGSLGIPGKSFTDGKNPPAHARCRCVTHLWAVGYVKGLNAMQVNEGTAAKQSALARYDATIDVRGADAESRTIVGAVASDESIDSHGSIIKAKGWKLDRYHANPLLLWQHKSGGYRGGEPEDILGSAKLYVKGKQLLADLHFAPEGENPKADMVWKQIQRGEVRGLSVGFRPLKYSFDKLDEASEDETMVIHSAELAELSVVMVPSNPNTLIKQVRSMAQAGECSCPDTDTREDNEQDNDVTDPGNPGGKDAVNDRESSPQDTRQKGPVPMSENKTVTIPAGLAAVLGTDDPEEAKRKFAKAELRIAQLEEERDQAKAEAEQAKSDLDKYRNEAADQAVEELVGLGLIKEDNRAVAQSFARSDLAGFTEMYAEQRANLAKRAAPKEHLLDNVVPPKREDTKPTMPLAELNSKLRSRAHEIMNAEKCDLATAYERAGAELEGK